MSHWEVNGTSDDWYTPRYIFEALGCDFDLDVASPPHATHVPCATRISLNSLDEEWCGFVWMNPPFGARNGLVPWLEKFCRHGNGIALFPDRTSAPWFQQYAERFDCILFLSPKVKFERPDGSVGNSPSNGTALAAIGLEGSNALIEAAGLGVLFFPRRTQEGRDT